MKPEDSETRFIAYEIYENHAMHLRAAPISRPWMDATQKSFAYRCLPMTIANQAGWTIANPRNFTALWNGGGKCEDTVFSFTDGPPDERISCIFGHGIITFNMPFLFRTPLEISLWVKGPSNWPKHGLSPLEGLVETDWTSASFTMNWKITRPNEVVRFDRGEPCCMVVPFPRGWLEKFQPSIQPLASNSVIATEYARWSGDRDAFHERIAAGDEAAISVGWQKDYFHGKDPGTDKCPTLHQTKLVLREFSREKPLSNGVHESSTKMKDTPISNGCPVSTVGSHTDLRKLNWLASYPKSGNTWVRAFLAAYAFDTQGPIELTQLNQVSRSESKFDMFTAIAGKSREQLVRLDVDSLRYAVQERLAKTISKKCVIKTHNAYSRSNGFTLICREFTRRALYIIRNPLDIADSLADHANVSIDSAIDWMNDRNHRLGGPNSKLVMQYVESWSQHVQSWTSQRDFPLLVVRYEDLKSAPKMAFEQIIRFLEWDFDEARLERAISRSDFKSLQNAESQTGFDEKTLVATSGRFFRRGESGAWSKILNAKQIASIIEHHHATMKAFGYPA